MPNGDGFAPDLTDGLVVVGPGLWFFGGVAVVVDGCDDRAFFACWEGPEPRGLSRTTRASRHDRIWRC